METQNIAEGKLPGGTEIPVYQSDEFNRCIANLPARYADVTDFEL